MISVVTVAFVLVVTGGPVLLHDLSVDECLSDDIDVSHLSGINFDASALQHVPRPVPDTSAEECTDTVHLEECREGPVGVFTGIEDEGFSALGIEHLELSGLSEVLEHRTVAVSDCEFHDGGM